MIDTNYTQSCVRKFVLYSMYHAQQGPMMGDFDTNVHPGRRVAGLRCIKPLQLASCGVRIVAQYTSSFSSACPILIIRRSPHPDGVSAFSHEKKKDLRVAHQRINHDHNHYPPAVPRLFDSRNAQFLHCLDTKTVYILIPRVFYQTRWSRVVFW